MIEPPSKDTRLRASWGSAVADAVNRHEAALSVKAARIANGRDAIGAAFPFQAIGGSYEGSATITLYVPAGSVVVADEEIDAGDIDGISAVDGAPGYYTVDDLDDLATTAAGAQPLYLVIWRDDTETTPSTNATVTLDPESVEGTVILQATIALVWASTVTTSEDGSKTYGAVSEQIIRSAVHVGRGQLAQSGNAKEFLYSYKLSRDDNRIIIYLRDKHLMIDGTYVDVLDANANNTHCVSQRIFTNQNATDVYLNIAKDTNGWSASFGQSAVQGAKWSICIGHVERLGYAGANPVLNYVVGALILNSGNLSSSDTGDAPTEDVVTDVSYDEYSHKLTQTKKTVTVVASTDTTTSSDVFEATDHANEHSNSLPS